MSKIEELAREIQVCTAELLTQEPVNRVGMLVSRKMSRVLLEASQRPDPRPLWTNLWNEGELCCLFATNNAGKSIYAVQIGNAISERQKVLYFDFELSDKQVQLRYTGEDESKELFYFNDNLERVELDIENLTMSNFEEALINDIERMAVETGAKVLIIDNLTFLCNGAEKGERAGNLMLALTKMKKKHDLSILVLAHTPKRPLTSPITGNDLAGSSKLLNFFDSAFAIGYSSKEKSIRYVKQIKYRSGEFTHGGDNVLVYSIEKNNSFVAFNQIGYSDEREHLREPSEEDREMRILKAKEMKEQGVSNREIAREMGVSEGAVRKWFK